MAIVTFMPNCREAWPVVEHASATMYTSYPISSRSRVVCCTQQSVCKINDKASIVCMYVRMYHVCMYVCMYVCM